MPLNVVVNLGTRPVPQIVPPADVVRQARAAGNPNAARALAVARPFLRIDQTGLLYDTRPAARPTQFRFRTGVLRLTLRQTIHIANDISACARAIWAGHEQDHVTDNQRIMGQMNGQIRAHRNLQNIFFTPAWHPIGSFNAIQNRIQATVADIFRQLVSNAVRRRDTEAEYARVQRTILRTCPGPFYHEVVRRDTLSKLSQFYYGNYRHWPAIYSQNRAVIGSDPDLIVPGQRLVIPKNP